MQLCGTKLTMKIFTPLTFGDLVNKKVKNCLVINFNIDEKMKILECINRYFLKN